MKSFYLFFLTCFCSAFVQISQAQIAAGDRTLAFQVDIPSDGDYDAAYQKCSDACMTGIHASFEWRRIEPDQSGFSAEATALLDALNYYNGLFGTSVELNINVVNTTQKSVPQELLEVDYDDPIFIDRFKALLDEVMTRLGDIDLAALNIGNEIDIFFGTDADSYARYATFLEAVVPYAKQKYAENHTEELNCGATCTFFGLVGATQRALCHQLNEHCDVISTTYYPIGAGFQVMDPALIPTHFQQMVEEYDDGKDFIIAECGYPSSPDCGSSEDLQAEFISKVFDAWDQQIDRIPYLTFFKSHDWDPELAESFSEFYFQTDPVFASFLLSLGFATYDNVEKAAFNRIRCHAMERGFCDAICLTNVEEIQKAQKIFPNPSTGAFNFESTTIQDFRVFNSAGQKIYTGKTNRPLDLSNYANGLYAIVFENGTRQQLVLQR